MKKLCPCGSGKEYDECCYPILIGEQNPKTPEALMRSRYTAYVEKDFDYIEKTMRGLPLKQFDKKASIESANEISWLGLIVIDSTKCDSTSKVGFVEFIAKYECRGRKYSLHERSEFHRDGARWFYVAGKVPKIGRNEPCPCGSGKKYKSCCQIFQKG